MTVRGLDKSFGRKTVLSGLDVHVPAGQFVAIVGRSGCGKSTLLRLIAGLEPATAGTISFGEEDLTAISAAMASPIAVVRMRLRPISGSARHTSLLSGA